MASTHDNLAELVGGIAGMDALLPALEGLAPAWLVGGAVRDLLRGAEAVDIDLAIEGDAIAVARGVAARLGGVVVEHGRFGTATISAPAVSVDLAATRRERYTRPGALPEVEPAPIADDLARRDFSINAIAVRLSGAAIGEVLDPQGGRADLSARVVRILHEQSFIDDPTRLLRAARYAARLGSALDPDTEAAARAAVGGGALSTVSGARIRDELMDLLAEPTAPDAVRLVAELGIDRGLHPALRADPERVAAAQLGAIETGADPALSALAALCVEDREAIEPWVSALDLDATARDSVLRAVAAAPGLAAVLEPDMRASAIFGLLDAEPPEALALALALGAPGAPVLRYAAELRGARLQISGDDLVAAGIVPSPAIGRALSATLERVLDGELSAREEQLEAALELAREAS